MSSFPSNPKVVLLRTKIAEAQQNVSVCEAALKSLQASCIHDFQITIQGAHVYDFGRREGDSVFKRDECCKICSMTHKAEDNLPHCLDCNKPLLRASYDYVKDHLDEFEQVRDKGSLAKDSFPMGMPYGYRCEHCGRAHVYCSAGD